MRILINIYHPKHVHFYKNLIRNLEEDGHEVKLTARDKDVTLQLMNAYGFQYDNIGKYYQGFLRKALGLVEKDFKLLKIARKFKPDILTGCFDIYGAHVAKIIGKPSFYFTDSEPARLYNLLAFPFTAVVFTPTGYTGKIPSKKHVRYNGYHELAYLHPNYFKPNPDTLEGLDVDKNDYAVLRFVAFRATHDFRHKGFSMEMKREIIEELQKHCEIFITSESELPRGFEKYRIPLPPHRIHDLLHYAKILVCDSQTMATEAGILGTPAIRSNTLVGTMSNFRELQEKYGLVYSYQDPRKALEKALELLENENLKKKWEVKREKLLRDKIDVTAFMKDFFERYPDSFHEYIEKRI